MHPGAYHAAIRNALIQLSQPYVGPEEKQAVMDVLESGMLAQGEQVSLLEASFQRATGARHAIAVSSGTAALHVALLASGIGPGDEVITTPFTFIATVNSILMAGAVPVFVDIDADTFNIDPALVEAAVTPRTKAILPVHLFGHPADLAALNDIAKRHGLTVIEDAAQAIGASIGEAPVGGSGTACFSLYATKNIFAGEGGMVTTNDDAVAERCMLLRSHGMRERYRHEMLGYNYRMTDIAAAIANVQLRRLDDVQRARSANAEHFGRHLASCVLPHVRDGHTHAWHQYTVRFPRHGAVQRDDAARRLRDAGIATGVFYPVPAHRQPHIADAYAGTTLPVAERACEEVLSLPVHPRLSDGERETIVSAVNAL